MGGESNRPWWQRGVQIAADTDGGAPALSTDVLRFQQELFADLRRGIGAVVISALLSGLKDGNADANKDGTVTVSELQAYVSNEVRKLTGRAQNPTVRRENLDYDFRLY
jgi:hypothetical protein